MNSPFGNNRPNNNGNGGNSNNNGKFTETVIIDNKFHQRLSNVRNRDVQENHPDIDLLKREAQQQSQRHLATLYRMPAMKEPDAPGTAPAVDPATTIACKAPSQVSTFHDCMRRLELETKRSAKFERPFALAIVGFNDLVHVVNSFGVLAYEQALGHIDSVLCNVVDTDIDTVGRYSNDRFMVLMPECTGPLSTNIAEAIRQFFDQVPVNYQGRTFFLKASIGIACFPNHGTDWKEILARADLTCESVLSRGGNAFGFASMVM